MEVRIFTKEMSASEVKKVKEYSMSKVEQIESLLKHFAYDATKLHVNAEKLGRRSAYRVEFVLYLPSKIIVGREASHEITKAVDLAKDRIVRQLKKHEELLRSKNGKKRKTNRKEIDFTKLDSVSELKKAQKDIFMDVLMPHLEKLHKFIRREIFYNESIDIIPEGEMDGAAIINDVILEFYANYNPQMAGKDLEQWLYTVSINRIRTNIDQLREDGFKTVPIEEDEIRPTMEDAEDYFEMKEIASFVDDVSDKTASKQELFKFLMTELMKVEEKKKEAFILNKLEGFVAAQISDIQHRPLKAVKADIEEVQKALAEKARAEFGEEIE